MNESAKNSREERREEALMYLDQVITANRTTKEWMLKHAIQAVAAESGLYYLFKKVSEYNIITIAIVLHFIVLIIGLFFLHKDQQNIEKMRYKERKLILETPLPWIRENWNPEKGSSRLFFWVYAGAIAIITTIFCLKLLFNAFN